MLIIIALPRHKEHHYTVSQAMSSDEEDESPEESEWAKSTFGWRLKHGPSDREENKFVLIRGRRSSKPLEDLWETALQATITPTIEKLGEAKMTFRQRRYVLASVRLL